MLRQVKIGGMVIALVCSLVACGGAPPTQSPTAAPVEATPEETAVQPAAADGAALLEARCAECHSLERVTGTHKNRDGWVRTVGRMVEKGARLSADEQEILVDYLTETYGQ